MSAVTVQIVGMGASTPIGRNIWSSAAAARAGLRGFSEHPAVNDTAGEPMRVARAKWLAPSADLSERCVDLLCPALDEALAAVPDREALAKLKVGVALALPPGRPGRPSDLADRVIDSARGRCPGRLAGVIVIESGHAAGLAALDAAVQHLSSARAHLVVVAGVDSYVDRDTLAWLEGCEQVHGAGDPENTWGFIPGEAAGVLIATTPSVAESLRANSLGEIVRVGLAMEPHPIKTDAVCIGEGLTAAISAALSGLPLPERVSDIFCDLNGEPYRADEYAFAILRTKERLRAASEFVAPADAWGDVGAAGAPLHVALALISGRKGYANGSVALTFASSEGGERGAAIVRVGRSSSKE